MWWVGAKSPSLLFPATIDITTYASTTNRWSHRWSHRWVTTLVTFDRPYQFIATNLDAVTHLTAVQEWAGNNAMVGAIKGCTGQEPTLVGKPSPLMIDYLEFKYGIDKVRWSCGHG